MIRAFYMDFVSGCKWTGCDRVGGLPTHTPPKTPCCSVSGRELAFLAQFYCSGERLSLSNVLCIHLYQDPDVGCGGDPLPVAIGLPLDSPVNAYGVGLRQEGISEYRIDWKLAFDPRTEPPFPDDLPLCRSKIGGLCLHKDIFVEGEKYLMQLRERPANFNFASRTCIVSITHENVLNVHLA
jgi:hypothetical protein